MMQGEVDPGFVIWDRAQKYQESAATMMNQAIASYSRFLVELKMRFEVVCISTPRLTHSGWQRLGDIANARREVIAPQTDRTALSLEFNQAMQLFLRTKRYPPYHSG
ncbi:MAG: hypothetical protein ACXV7E_00015 [Methylobacter sp.]